jgi:hypothetical protein
MPTAYANRAPSNGLRRSEMANDVYDILKDGTIVEDKYVEAAVNEVDEALKNGNAKIVFPE